MRGPWLLLAVLRRAANLQDAAAGGVLNAIGHAGEADPTVGAGGRAGVNCIQVQTHTGKVSYRLHIHRSVRTRTGQGTHLKSVTKRGCVVEK